jgi:translation initiation factor 1
MPIVFSTDPDPQPQQKETKSQGPPSAKNQLARIWRDSKRRAGKTVTVVGNLNHDPATLERLCKELKNRCGAGGTVKEKEIEIQGDHRDRVAAYLQSLGYKTKMVGG